MMYSRRQLVGFEAVEGSLYIERSIFVQRILLMHWSLGILNAGTNGTENERSASKETHTRRRDSTFNYGR